MDEKKGFFETVFEGLPEVAAKHINQLLRDITPKVIDWVLDQIMKFGTKKYEDLKSNYSRVEYAPLPRANRGSLSKTSNLSDAVEDYKSNKDSREAQQKLVEAISVEVSENYDMWEKLSRFVQEVECPYCGQIITDDWYDYVSGESTSERNMGTEILFSIESDDYICPKCNRVFSVEGYICTYPDGIYDSHELKTSKPDK